MITKNDLSIEILVDNPQPAHHCEKIAEVTYDNLRFEIDYYHIPTEDSNWNHEQDEHSHQIYVYDIFNDDDFTDELCNGDSTIEECIENILNYLNRNLTNII